MQDLLRFRVLLTWNGSTVLDARATAVVATEIVRAHFADNFAGVAHKRFVHGMEGGRLLAKVQALEPGGRAARLEYADASGAATAAVERLNLDAPAAPAGYTLDAGRTIVGPSGMRLANLDMQGILAPSEADRFARQIVAALNADPSRPDVRAAPALSDAARALQSHLTAKAQQSPAFRDWLAEDGGRELMGALAAALDAPKA